MTRDLAVAPDTGAALDLYKGAHLGSVADRATVQVDQAGLVNHHVPAQTHILSNHANLMIGIIITML